MVSVAEATSIILSHLFVPEKERISIAQSAGRTLAESINADRDFPPFDRVTMDGIAMLSTQFQQGTRAFRIQSTQAAGQPRATLSDPLQCVEVMTGVVLPAGADTVVRYEDLVIEQGIAHIRIEKIAAGENIHFRGVDAKKDVLLLSPGMLLSAAEVALLASVGKSAVDVFAFPTTAIVSTGDELVPVDQVPLPHQVRQSNAYALQAAVHELRGTADLFSIADNKDVLEKKLSRIFADHRLIILSGGVSKGKFDYVPQVLESLGVKKHFHQVSQKPGKPFWFGTSSTQTVFALPGNPVSTFMCFYRFIKPWLTKSVGTEAAISTAVLAKDFTFMLPLTYFLQVKIRNEAGTLMAFPDAGGGSGDFANLREVDGFLELPAEQRTFRKGEEFTYVPFR